MIKWSCHARKFEYVITAQEIVNGKYYGTNFAVHEKELDKPHFNVFLAATIQTMICDLVHVRVRASSISRGMTHSNATLPLKCEKWQYFDVIHNGMLMRFAFESCALAFGMWCIRVRNISDGVWFAVQMHDFELITREMIAEAFGKVMVEREAREKRK